ncbi:hypothetical protein CRG98_041281 [Punica granatum]|uniref:Uncharacterized protein n=1 Tax=Punica granatum TaxID=22663 RepID=A0A2I0I3A7_PUNGR|nr:hypothetical protein CRG98_041281 [Punica granatum]
MQGEFLTLISAQRTGAIPSRVVFLFATTTDETGTIGPPAINFMATRAPSRRIKETRKEISRCSLGREEAGHSHPHPQFIRSNREEFSGKFIMKAHISLARHNHDRPNTIMGSGGPTSLLIQALTITRRPRPMPSSPRTSANWPICPRPSCNSWSQ